MENVQTIGSGHISEFAFHIWRTCMLTIKSNVKNRGEGRKSGYHKPPAAKLQPKKHQNLLQPRLQSTPDQSHTKLHTLLLAAMTPLSTWGKQVQ